MKTTVKTTLIPSAFTAQQQEKINSGDYTRSRFSNFSTAVDAKRFFDKIKACKYIKVELI